MADPYQLLERDARETESALSLADHNRIWANTFRSTPPTEVLRANRNYDDLISNAIHQRSQIRPQVDPKAQKMEFDRQLQPLREQLLQGQIEHQAASTLAAGATTRFAQQKDKETMGHIVGFADYMEKAPPVDSPEYRGYVLHGVKLFPRMITTGWGKETLGKIAEEHDTIANFSEQMKSMPEEFQVKNVRLGGKRPIITAERKTDAAGASQYDSPDALLKDNPNSQYRQDPKTGGYFVTKAGVTAKTKPGETGPADQYFSAEALLKDNPGARYRQDPKSGGYYVASAGDDKSGKTPAAALTNLGKLTGALAVKDYYLSTEKEPEARKQLVKERAELAAQIEGWHQTFGNKAGMNAAVDAAKPDATPTATPKHLGKYNPKTGAFE